MFTDAWQPRQALLDVSALLTALVQNGNIIIHILYPIYWEMLMSLGKAWRWGGGVESGGNGLVALASVAVAVCLFVYLLG